MTRRALLSKGACGVGLLAVGGCREPRPSEMSWEEFLRRASFISKDAVARGLKHEASALALLGRELARVALPQTSGDSSVPGQDILSDEPTFVAARHVLGPQETIQPHDHLGYSGVFRVAHGEVEVTSYDLVEHIVASDGWNLRLTKASQRTLGPGEIASISLAGPNIHGLTAGRRGAELIDVYAIYERPPRSRQLVIGRARRGVLKARYA